MWNYKFVEKYSVPWIDVDLRKIAYLPANPVALGKASLVLSDALVQQVVSDVEPKQSDVPEVSSFGKVHRDVGVSRTAVVEFPQINAADGEDQGLSVRRIRTGECVRMNL